MTIKSRIEVTRTLVIDDNHNQKMTLTPELDGKDNVQGYILESEGCLIFDDPVDIKTFAEKLNEYADKEING